MFMDERLAKVGVKDGKRWSEGEKSPDWISMPGFRNDAACVAFTFFFPR